MVALFGVLGFALAIGIHSVTCNEPISSKIYYFANGDECIDDCDYYGHTAKWCYTVSDKWRECSESGENSLGHQCLSGACDANNHCLNGPDHRCTITRQRTAKYWTNGGHRCLSECRRYEGTEYSWCRYGTREQRYWDKCSEIEGHTVYGNQCHGKCEWERNFFAKNNFRCLINAIYLEDCSPVESLQPCIVFNQNRTRILGMENVNKSVHGPLCIVVAKEEEVREKYFKYRDELRRRRRQYRQNNISQQCSTSRAGNVCGDDTENQLQDIRRNLLNMPGMTVFQPQDPTNPIQDVLRLEFRPGVFRTQFLYAVIQAQHVGHARSQFRGRTTTLDYFRRELNALPDDDRGHLLADSLGGVSADYNLVPQTRDVNRRLGGELYTEWTNTERRMREFFAAPNGPGSQGGHIDYTVIPIYSTDDTGRPSSIWMNVKFVLPSGRLEVSEVFEIN